MTVLKPNPVPGELDEKCIQTIRFLSMDGVQKANSGHPGMPMGMAPAVYTLWTKYMKHNPANPKWHNRDRFVLSAGHGSMLLYSLLHLAGFGLSLEDLKKFRQWGSRTPGHPEYGHTAGVEATTGPLGQGIGNAVGMAIAQKYLAATYNKDGFKLFDYNIYTIAGDGCLQEGVSSEACSLAGHLGLDNLVLVYDDNYITIDGDTSLSFTEDRAKRFEAYGWDVQVVGGNGNDMAAFEDALKKAKTAIGKPSMIQLRTHIGYGSPNKQDSSDAHGAPLGEDEIKLIKKNFGWNPEKTFVVPDEVAARFEQVKRAGGETEKAWNEMFDAYCQNYPELGKQLKDAEKGVYCDNIDELLPRFEAGTMATRKASGAALNALMPEMPLVLGGSADLTPSNNTRFRGAVDYQKDTPGGRYLRYGVREHGMAAVMNGICLSGLLKAYGGTFFCFCDYMKPAIRVAALSGYSPIYVFTHDSIGLGEDGPTHQPVEHIASLRSIPNMLTIRPADANEAAAAWKVALENTAGPTALLLTRQNVLTLDQDKYPSAANLANGAYVLTAQDSPDVILMATGSEVELVLAAAEKLATENVKAQVVSMPCWELFERQDKAYRDSVLPPNVRARVAVEAGVEQGWRKYIGDEGVFIGMKSFGASAPCEKLYEEFGITVDAIIKSVKSCRNDL